MLQLGLKLCLRRSVTRCLCVLEDAHLFFGQFKLCMCSIVYIIRIVTYLTQLRLPSSTIVWKLQTNTHFGKNVMNNDMASIVLQCSVRKSNTLSGWLHELNDCKEALWPFCCKGFCPSSIRFLKKPDDICCIEKSR